MMKLLPLGGAGEIGASCFYLNIEGTGIILDSGMHPQKIGLDSLPNFELLEDKPIDYVLISHAHQDHLSSLPYLVQRYPHVKIITTPQTRALAELTLHNSVSILKQQLTEEDAMKIYSHDEVDLLIQSIDYRAYNDELIINGFMHTSNHDIKAKFYDAGHILGSAGILIEHAGEKLFYTGDINFKNQSFLTGAKLPKEKTTTLLLETTYGATDSNSILSWNKEAERLAASINKIINKGGSVLIPAFSLGKTQEMLKTLWDFMQKGKLTTVDIYNGGIATKINRVYDYNRYVVNVQEPDFQLKDIPLKNLYEVEKSNDFFKHPCLVLAPSGMMIEGTASFKLARNWLSQRNSAIFTVGYMEESTPGYKVANSKKGDKIKLSKYDEEQEVKCEIKQFRFSAHSRREDLLEIVKKSKPENVVLIHGDPDAIDWMGASILKQCKGTRVYAAETKKQIILEKIQNQ